MGIHFSSAAIAQTGNAVAGGTRAIRAADWTVAYWQGRYHGPERGARLRLPDTLRHGDARREVLAAEAGARGADYIGVVHDSFFAVFAAAVSINSCSCLAYHAYDQPELALRRVLQANALAPAKPPSIRIETIFTNWLPFVALVAVYAATQVAAKLKVRQ